MEYKIVENKTLGFQVQETIDDFGQKAVTVTFLGIEVSRGTGDRYIVGLYGSKPCYDEDTFETEIDISIDFYNFIEKHYDDDDKLKEKL
jgi:hypothetical protein